MQGLSEGVNPQNVSGGEQIGWVAGVRGTGGSWGDRPVSRLGRASQARGSAGVRGVLCWEAGSGFGGAWAAEGRKAVRKCQDTPGGR